MDMTGKNNPTGQSTQDPTGATGVKIIKTLKIIKRLIPVVIDGELVAIGETWEAI